MKLHRIRHKLGLWLLRREGRDVKDALWEVMNCGIDSFGPATVELAVEPGHNQVVLLKNGCRRVHISLHADQVNMEIYAVGPDDKGHYFGNAHVMIPYEPSKMLALAEARK